MTEVTVLHVLLLFFTSGAEWQRWDWRADDESTDWDTVRHTSGHRSGKQLYTFSHEWIPHLDGSASSALICFIIIFRRFCQMESHRQRQIRITLGLRCWPWCVDPPLTAPPLPGGHPPPLDFPHCLISRRQHCQLYALQSQTRHYSCRWHASFKTLCSCSSTFTFHIVSIYTLTVCIVCTLSLLVLSVYLLFI